MGYIDIEIQKYSMTYERAGRIFDGTDISPIALRVGKTFAEFIDKNKDLLQLFEGNYQ